MSRPVLYDYWRSSASYRVRIALNLCNIEFDTVPVDLLTGEHGRPPHLEINPQGFVPALAADRLRTVSLVRNLARGLKYVFRTIMGR